MRGRGIRLPPACEGDAAAGECYRVACASWFVSLTGRAGWDRGCPAWHSEAPVPARCGSWPPPSHPAFSPEPRAPHILECSASRRPHSSLLLGLSRRPLKVVVEGVPGSLCLGLCLPSDALPVQSQLYPARRLLAGARARSPPPHTRSCRA